MLRKIRLVLATVFFIGITLLFLDVTGGLHTYFGWMAKVQFWPALMQLSLCSIGIVAFIVIITLIFGRIYCSVICPLGIFQDIIARIGRIGRRNPYHYSREKKWLRYPALILMLIAIPFGLTSILAPYSAFGRIAVSLFRPGYIWVNNQLAQYAAEHQSYLFYGADTLAIGGITLIVAIATVFIIVVLAARGGRTYCNTICPVGTILSFFARHSRLKITIDADRCRNCRKCERNCKAACIDIKNHTVDYSRCVVCGDCLGQCNHDAISYGHKKTIEHENQIVKEHTESTKKKGEDQSIGRRSFLLATAMATTAALVGQEKKKSDTALAIITDKQTPNRKTPILPPGAVSMKHMSHHCTACQLCVSACPNKVLRPSTDINHFMQPVMSYEYGYCRPECHACSDVCPAGAIEPVGLNKAFTKIGTAHVIIKNCLSAGGEVTCGNCARHCPVGAIEMQLVPLDPDDEYSMEVEIPTVDENRCIGCGACENLCPVRPLSAIYVDGLDVHKKL